MGVLIYSPSLFDHQYYISIGLNQTFSDINKVARVLLWFAVTTYKNCTSYTHTKDPVFVTHLFLFPPYSWDLVSLTMLLFDTQLTALQTTVWTEPVVG